MDSRSNSVADPPAGGSGFAATFKMSTQEAEGKRKENKK